MHWSHDERLTKIGDYRGSEIVPARAVARDVARAEALGADLDRVAGTSLDMGAELDALVSNGAFQI